MNFLLGFQLHATDGYIGKVEDFHFDNETWEVRHILANTRPHLVGHRVLIPHSVLGRVDWVDRAIRVDQSRREIKHDPDELTDMPIFKEVEQQAINFYSWAAHWPPFSSTPPPNPDFGPPPHSNLRSLRHLSGYRICGTDHVLGRLDDLIVDDVLWRVRLAVVELTAGLTGRRVVTPVEEIESISFEDRTLLIDSDVFHMSNAPEYEASFLNGEDTVALAHDYFTRVHRAR